MMTLFILGVSCILLHGFIPRQEVSQSGDPRSAWTTGWLGRFAVVGAIHMGQINGNN